MLKKQDMDIQKFKCFHMSRTGVRSINYKFKESHAAPNKPGRGSQAHWKENK